MPNLNLWLSNRPDAPSAETRAVDAWARIQERPTTITFINRAVTQQLRVEWDNTNNAVGGSSGVAQVRELVLFGVVGHPDTDVDDSDIKPGDIFAVNSTRYKVLDVISPPGELQARCERQSGG